MNEIISRSRLAAFVVMITVGVAAFAAFSPNVANAEARGEPADAVRHESAVEPIRANEAGDHPLSCESESETERQPEVSSAPMMSNLDCPSQAPAAREETEITQANLSCCEGVVASAAQSETEERTGADEDEHRSSATEDVDSKEDDDDRAEATVLALASDVDLRDDRAPSREAAAGDLVSNSDFPGADGVLPSNDVLPARPPAGNEVVEPSPVEPSPPQPSAVGPSVVEPSPSEPNSLPLAGVGNIGSGESRAAQTVTDDLKPPAALSAQERPNAAVATGVSDEAPGGQPVGQVPNPAGASENTAVDWGTQGASGDNLPSAQPANGRGLFAVPPQQFSLLALPAGLGVVLAGLWWRKSRRGHARSGTLPGELSDEAFDATSSGYHEAGAYFGGSINGADGDEQNIVVLAADGDAATLRVIERDLTARGFAVVPVRTGSEALLNFGQSRPDIVLLADTMPDIDRAALMRTLQRTGVPVILVMDGNDAEERVRALELGADDCLVKGFVVAELAARIRAVLRRTNGGHRSAQIIRLHDLEVNLARHTVRRNGDLLELTPTEWRLLQHLIMNAGRLVLKEEILEAVWGSEYRDASDYLRVWIPLLRRRLGSQAAQSIKTVHGLGYILNPPTSEPSARRELQRDHAPPKNPGRPA